MIALVVLLLTPPFLAAFVAVTVGAVEPGREQRLRPDAVRGHAAPEHRGARRRQAADGAGEHALRVARWSSSPSRWGSRCPAAGRSWSDEARGLTEFFGAPRAIVVALLCLLGLLATTWKQLVQGLAIGLTGREGLIKSSVLVRLSSLVLIGLIAHLLNVSRDARIFLWNAVPWIPAVPVFFKMCAAAWIATRLHRDRLLGDRALVTGAAAWLAVVLALYGVLAWILDTPHIGALLPDAPGHPGRAPGAAVRRPAGPGVEPASRNGAARRERASVAGDRPSARRSSSSPCPWRWPWSRASPSTSGTGTTAASCPRARSARTGCTCRRATTAPGPRRSSSACTAGGCGGPPRWR